MTILNNDTSEVSLDCLFKTVPHLEVHASPTVLKPHEKMEVPIRFVPKGEAKYKETIPFDINGLQTINVEVSGEGIRVRHSSSTA